VQHIVLVLMTAETFAAMEEFFGLPDADKLAASWLKTPGARGYESFADVALNEGSGNDSEYASPREGPLR